MREIRGDLVLDRSAFDAIAHDAAAFDGEALRPYNAGPDALLLNYKAVSFHFVPDPESRQVRVFALPVIAGMTVPLTVKTIEGPCNDWRARVGGDFADPMRPQFRGVFPAVVRRQGVAREPAHAGAVRAGRCSGSCGKRAAAPGAVVRATALVPADARRIALHESRPLAEVIRDINKFSNNVMARQLFLTIGAETSRQPATMERAQRAVGDWLVSRGLDRARVRPGKRRRPVARRADDVRWTRPPARRLVQLPADAGTDASLPIVGVDGTMRKRLGAAGSAHIKTGLLVDARADRGLRARGQRPALRDRRLRESPPTPAPPRAPSMHS